MTAIFTERVRDNLAKLVLRAVNNLADVADVGSSQYNLRVPILRPAQAVATSNVASRSGTTTLDGVALVAGDRVLLTAQTTGSQNGVWLVAAGAWTRPTDYPAGGSLKGRCIQVNAGTLYGGTLWMMTTTSTVTIDTTSTTWAQSNATLKSRREVAISAAGLITCNFNLELATNTLAPATGNTYGMVVGLLAGDVVTNLCFAVSTAGVGTAPTLFRVGLANPAGTVVAVTADIHASSVLTTLGIAQVPLTAPYTVPAAGGYRIVILKVGAFATTDVVLARAPALPAAAMSAAIGSGIRTVATYGTSQPDLPTVGTALPSSTNAFTAYWVACT